MSAYGFVLSGMPTFQTQVEDPAGTIAVPSGPTKSAEDIQLEKFGLTWSLIESSKGNLAADKMREILSFIDDDFTPIELRCATASALLVWFSEASFDLRADVFDRFFFKTLEVIRFTLLDISVNSLSIGPGNKQRPAHYLALWLQKQCFTNNVFRARIAVDIIQLFGYLIEGRVNFADAPYDSGVQALDSEEVERAETLKVLLKCLPRDLDDELHSTFFNPEQQHAALPVLLAMHDLAEDERRCIGVAVEVAEVIGVLTADKDEALLSEFSGPLLHLVQKGHGQVLTALQRCTSFFSAQSNEFRQSISTLLPRVGFAQAAKLLEELADTNPAALLPHIDAILDRIEHEAAEEQARIMRVLLSVSLVEPQALLTSVKSAAQRTLDSLAMQANRSLFAVIIPCIKLLAAVGTWSEAAALESLSAAALIARTLHPPSQSSGQMSPTASDSSLATSLTPLPAPAPVLLNASQRPPAQQPTPSSPSRKNIALAPTAEELRLQEERLEVEAALLELFNVLKDKVAYCNLFSQSTLQAIELMRNASPSTCENILLWNSGKRARRGDRRVLLLHAGELRANQIVSSANNSPSKSTSQATKTADSAQKRSWGLFSSPSRTPSSSTSSPLKQNNDVAAIAPSPASQTMSLSQRPQPKDMPSPSSRLLSPNAAVVPLPSSSPLPIAPSSRMPPSFPSSIPFEGSNSNQINGSNVSRRLFQDAPSSLRSDTVMTSYQPPSSSLSPSAAPPMSFSEFIALQNSGALPKTSEAPQLTAAALSSRNQSAGVGYGASAKSPSLVTNTTVNSSSRDNRLPASSPGTGGISESKRNSESPSPSSTPSNTLSKERRGLMRWLLSPLSSNSKHKNRVETIKEEEEPADDKNVKEVAVQPASTTASTASTSSRNNASILNNNMASMRISNNANTSYRNNVGTSSGFSPSYKPLASNFNSNTTPLSGRHGALFSDSVNNAASNNAASFGFDLGATPSYLLSPSNSNTAGGWQ